MPDRVVFDKLVQVLVLGAAYAKIADTACSATMTTAKGIPMLGMPMETTARTDRTKAKMESRDVPFACFAGAPFVWLRSHAGFAGGSGGFERNDQAIAHAFDQRYVVTEGQVTRLVRKAMDS